MALVVVHLAANQRVLDLIPTNGQDTLGFMDGQTDERV